MANTHYRTGFPALEAEPPTNVPKECPPRTSPAAAWIVFCAFCHGAGWVLSAVNQLDPVGYVVVFTLAAAGMWLWRSKRGLGLCPRFRLARWRLRRAFPLGFVLVASLAILGGILHPPTNYDALAYRTPRVLHWLADQHWHWIHTEFHRLNTRGCGIEWVTAPLIALTGTDRFIFVINAICFVLMPGRVFSVWTHLGVRRRVAWHWMWIFPTGYCYLLQAGSIGNDLFGALIALSAFEFALRASRSRRLGELWVAILAAGLMTAGKAFNLLLLLPWLLAAWPVLRLLVRRPLITALTLLTAAAASLLPMAVLNARYCGDWTGQTAEHLVVIGAKSPGFLLAVNSLLVPLHNFAPPIFPFSRAWGNMMHALIPPALAERLEKNFETPAARFELGEMQMEESAGLGLGVSALLLAVFVYRCVHRPRPGGAWPKLQDLSRIEWLLPLSTWVATALFMSQIGLTCPARYIAPFYPLLVPPLLAGPSGLPRLEGRTWFHRAGIAVFLVAASLVILSPPRPLWPATTVLRAWGADQSAHPLVRRAWTVYSVYGQRADAFQAVRAALPQEADPLGAVMSDDPETSLWRPFGSRRIIHVCQGDTREQLLRESINYVLVSSRVLAEDHHISLDDWLAQYQAQLLQRFTLELRAGRGPTEWFLVKLRH